MWRLAVAVSVMLSGVAVSPAFAQLEAADAASSPATAAASLSCPGTTPALTHTSVDPAPSLTTPADGLVAAGCASAQPRSHTGFAALLRTTGADFAALPRRRSTWTILAIGAGSAAAFHSFDDDATAALAGSSGADGVWAAGKVLGAAYTQVGVGTGLYLIGRYVLPRAAGEPRTNRVSHLGFDLVRAQILSQAIIHGMKYTIQRDRPTGECCAFPSGHAATAFAVASVLERHLGYRAAWPTLAAAAYVATSRMADNRHVLSDVLFGSAVGIATGWTVVGRHGRGDFALVPLPTRGGMAVALTYVGGTGGAD